MLIAQLSCSSRRRCELFGIQSAINGFEREPSDQQGVTRETSRLALSEA